ncbi:hypothetical protein BDD12DRAFT_921233 [Trichophaea hybrida]|nr:hypothetical protein BDD12DRAFT_921233 [Trichophaea hybrida]
MRRLTVTQFAQGGHCTPEIQPVLGLYHPKDQMTLNKCIREEIPVPQNHPLYFPQDSPELERRTLRSALPRALFVRSERIPGYNYPLSEYVLRFYHRQFGWTDLNSEIVGDWCAHQFRLLDVSITNVQSYRGKSVTVHKIRCTVGETDDERMRMDALVRLFHSEEGGKINKPTGLICVTHKDPQPDSRDVVMVSAKSIWGIMYLIPIQHSRRFFVNPTIDLKMFNSSYSRDNEEPADLPALIFESTDEGSGMSQDEFEVDHEIEDPSW